MLKIELCFPIFVFCIDFDENVSELVRKLVLLICRQVNWLRGRLQRCSRLRRCLQLWMQGLGCEEMSSSMARGRDDVRVPLGLVQSRIHGTHQLNTHSQLLPNVQFRERNKKETPSWAETRTRMCTSSSLRRRRSTSPKGCVLDAPQWALAKLGK